MIRYALGILFSFLYTIWGHLLYPVHLISGKRLGNWFFRTYGRLLFALTRIRIVVEGADLVDPQKQYLVVTNHQSLFDIPLMMAALPVETKYFAKKELSRIPIFGTILYLYDHMLVDRNHKREAVRSLEKSRKTLEKYSLVIFAEGTRSPDGKVHPFKTGATQLAIDAKATVLPVAICGTGELLPKGSYSLRKGHSVHVKIFPPLPYEEGWDRKELARRLETTIRSFVEQHNIGGTTHD